MKLYLIIAAIAVVAILVTQLVLSGMFGAKVDNLRRRLLVSQVSAAPDQSLIPDMVREFAARNGGRVDGPAAVHMVQSAEMRLRPDQAFFHINATQLSGTRDPGFVWYAVGTMAAIVPLQIVDSYVASTGWLEARIAGSIPVASAVGPFIDKSEAMRFLAELAWNPDGLISATGLTWRQVDNLTVEVSMNTQGGAARVSLLFDAAGDIIGIAADDRPRAVGKLNVPTRWIGRFSDYIQFGAYRWPRHGEIAWALPEGEFIYWRGDILSVTRAGTYPLPSATRG
jgi:hypothetical protein